MIRGRHARHIGPPGRFLFRRELQAGLELLQALLVALGHAGVVFDLAGLTLGATFTAVLMVTGAVTLAVGRHRAYLLGWLLATIVATAVLFGPGTLELRSVLALVIGPALGVLFHLAVLKAVVPEEPADMVKA